jgi:sugar phosphate isomerase/epimerase
MHEHNLRSIAYLTVSGAEPVAQIEAAAEAGVDAVGLRVVPPPDLSLPYPFAGSPDRIREIRAASERTGVRILDCEILTLTPRTDVDECIPALAAAAEIGSTYVQVISADADWGRAVDNFGRICDAAARLGLRIALEFMRWRSVRTIDEAAKFVRQSGRSNAGILLDTLHLSRSGGSPAAVAQVPPELLTYVQLCDAVAEIPTTDDALLKEARGHRLDPGAGTLWLEELFDVLPDDIAISFEVPDTAPGATLKERTRRAAGALDDWLARYRARSAGGSRPPRPQPQPRPR